jgi:general secretion pathway protein K
LPEPRKNQKGIALFLVLWVLTLLSVIVGEFCHTMRTEVNVTRNFKEETQAYYIAVAGLNIAISELVETKGNLWKLEIPEETEEIEWRINADIPPVAFAQGYFKITIQNESGKININKANQSLLKMMLGGFEIDEDAKNVIADSILDWRDSDDLHRTNGAEDEYYLSLPEPYECKDDDFDSVEELLLVKGITPEIFYGGLREMFTVWEDEKPQEKNRPSVDKININAASPEVLRHLPQMTDDLVKEIMDFRKEKDFRSLSELSDIVGSEIYEEIRSYFSSPTKRSAFFTIRSEGTIENSATKRRVQALVQINRERGEKYRIIQWLDDV